MKKSKDDGALINISSKSYIKIIGFEIRNYISSNYMCTSAIRVEGEIQRELK